MEQVKGKSTAFPARTVAAAALVCALSVVLPQVFHMVGGNAMGGAFLPMHLPVLLGGYLLNPAAALLCGALSPLLSFFISGMPAFPRLIFMVFELGAYGFFTSLFAHKCRLPVFLSLPLSWICGRLVYFFSVAFVLHVLHLEVPGMTFAFAAVWTALTAGVPGLLLQAVTVPILVAALKKARLISYVPRFGKL